MIIGMRLANSFRILNQSFLESEFAQVNFSNSNHWELSILINGEPSMLSVIILLSLSIFSWDMVKRELIFLNMK